MEKLSETRPKAQILVNLDTLEKILKQVLEHDWSSKNQNTDTPLWHPDTLLKYIKPGFWSALSSALFVKLTKKDKEPEDKITDDVFQYTIMDDQGAFTQTHQDSALAFYDTFIGRLPSYQYTLSPLALKLSPVVLKAFTIPQAQLKLKNVEKSIKDCPDIVLAAIEHDVTNLWEVKSDFFTSHLETQHQMIRILLRALAEDVHLGKDAYRRFCESFSRSSLAVPRLVVSSLQQANAVFDMLIKIVPMLVEVRNVVNGLLSCIDWNIPLQHPGEHAFLAVKKDPSLMAVFFPTYREKPEVVLALSKMGDGIAYNNKTISKTNWLKIYEQVALKISDGIRLYIRFLDGGDSIGKRGFFTGLRHGEKGRLRAEALEKKISETMKSSDPSDYFDNIKKFFEAEDTRFHNNSLSNFIRRELTKLPENVDANDDTQIDYEKACDLFGIDDKRFTHPLPEDPNMRPR